MGNKTVTLIDDETGKQVKLNVLPSSMGPHTIDISPLYKEMGYFTYDPGFVSTASCQSAITYMDGERGQLLYRGYPIDQLAEHSSYIETCYLLLYGNLPNKKELHAFKNIISEHTMPHPSSFTRRRNGRWE